MRTLAIAALTFAVAVQSAPRRERPEPAKNPRTLEGRQLSVTLSQSALTARPGDTVNLIADVVPGPKMHVYAPEQTGGYIRIDLTLDESPAFTAKPAAFPKATDYYFEPLDETFKVFDAPFRIMQDITLASTPALRRRAAEGGSVALTGTLRYQACDDQVCYRPDQIPVTWNIALAR